MLLILMKPTIQRSDRNVQHVQLLPVLNSSDLLVSTGVKYKDEASFRWSGKAFVDEKKRLLCSLDPMAPFSTTYSETISRLTGKPSRIYHWYFIKIIMIHALVSGLSKVLSIPGTFSSRHRLH